MNPTLLLAWFDEHSRVRGVVYTVALWVSIVTIAALWLLPLVDVDHLWRLDADDLAKIATGTGGVAALLAKRNRTPDSTPDDGE